MISKEEFAVAADFLEEAGFDQIANFIREYAVVDFQNSRKFEVVEYLDDIRMDSSRIGAAKYVSYIKMKLLAQMTEEINKELLSHAMAFSKLTFFSHKNLKLGRTEIILQLNGSVLGNRGIQLLDL